MGLPVETIASTDGFVLTAGAGSTRFILRDSYEFQSAPPRLDNERIRRQLSSSCRFNLPQFELARLKDVHLRSKRMYLLPRDRSAVLEMSALGRARYRRSCQKDALRRYRTRTMSGSYFLCFDRWGYRYYYHWMVDTLCRLLAVDRVPEETHIIMPRRPEPYMRRSLELMGGIDLGSLVHFDDTDWHLETCWFPTRPYGWFLPPQKEVTKVAGRLLASCRLRLSETIGTRLYVSRGRCRTRRFKNETAVRSCLERRGFKTYFPEEHTLDEQIAAFRHAETIVGSLGSGLTNIMFCRPGTKVSVLYDETFFDPCIWILGECFNLDMFGLSYHPSRGFDVRKFAALETE